MQGHIHLERIRYQAHGKRTDEKSCKLYDKPVEIPEKYPQGRFCGNIEQPL